MRALLLLGAMLSACLPPPTPEPVATPRGAAGPRIERRVVIVATRPSGWFSTATYPDGTITLRYDVVQNGRGPHVEGRLKLAPDWTLSAYQATGKHTMGTKISESFARRGDRVAWRSEEERGDRQIRGPAMYLPISEIPVEWLVVPAAIRAGGKLPLLPGGEARVTKVGDLAVAAHGRTRKLVGYAIEGLGLDTSYAWFDPDGTWFGTASAHMSIVPEGWEAAIRPLVQRQDALDRARDARLATLHATRPVSGFALTNARVLDVEKGTWTPGQTVVVVGDTIKAVGPDDKIRVPDGVDSIPMDGLGVMPGLIDMHAHLTPSDALLNIASGVTTVRDVGNDPDLLDDLKQRFDAGTMIGPHVVRMGFIEGRNPKAAASKVTAETPAEAKAAVELFAKRGYEGIKIYNSVRPELVPLLAQEAHARGMQVTGHVPVRMRASEVVAAGYDGIEHINMLFLNFFVTKDTDTRDTTRFTLVGDRAADFALDGKPALELYEQLRQKKTIVTPTLAVFEGLFVGVPGKITPGLEELVARLPPTTARGFVVGGLPMDQAKRALYARSWDKILGMVKALWQAKVHLVLGTDHIAGLMLHHEMTMFARAGIPAKDILQMATIDAARAMKLDKKIGTIAPGKRADLVIVEGDPLEDLKAIRKTVYTMRGGVLFRSDALYGSIGVKP